MTDDDKTKVDNRLRVQIKAVVKPTKEPEPRGSIRVWSPDDDPTVAVPPPKGPATEILFLGKSHLHSGEKPFGQSSFTGIRQIKVFRRNSETVEERCFILGIAVPKTWYARLRQIWKENGKAGETLAEYAERNRETVLGMLK